MIGLGRTDHAVLGATIFGMVALIGYHQQLRLGKRSWPRRLFYAGVTIVAIVFVVLTQSRGPALALGATLLGVALWLRQRTALVVIGLAALLYVALQLLGGDEMPSVLTRHGLDSFRLEIWSQAIEQFKQAVWFGHGLSVTMNYSTSIGIAQPHPHNLVLATAIYGGVTALALLLGIMWIAFKQALRTAKRDQDYTLISLLSYSYLSVMTDGHMLVSSPWPVWIYFWLPVALSAAMELDTDK